MSVAELKKEYAEKQGKLIAYKLDLKSAKEKDTSKVKVLKRDVARILTVLKLKSLAGEITAAVANEVKVSAEAKDSANQKESKKD